MNRTRKPPSAIQEQLIAALLPDVHAEPPPPSPGPLPALPAPTLPASTETDRLLVGMARLDRSGRLHERRLLRALGWAPGQRLALVLVTTVGAQVPQGCLRESESGPLGLVRSRASLVVWRGREESGRTLVRTGWGDQYKTSLTHLDDRFLEGGVSISQDMGGGCP
jgi:hypothetical protein